MFKQDFAIDKEAFWQIFRVTGKIREAKYLVSGSGQSAETNGENRQNQNLQDSAEQSKSGNESRSTSGNELNNADQITNTSVTEYYCSARFDTMQPFMTYPVESKTNPFWAETFKLETCEMFQNLRFTVYRNDQGAPRAVGKIVIPANVIKQEEEDHWFALSNAFYEDKVPGKVYLEIKCRRLGEYYEIGVTAIKADGLYKSDKTTDPEVNLVLSVNACTDDPVMTKTKKSTSPDFFETFFFTCPSNVNLDQVFVNCSVWNEKELFEGYPEFLGQCSVSVGSFLQESKQTDKAWFNLSAPCDDSVLLPLNKKLAKKTLGLGKITHKLIKKFHHTIADELYPNKFHRLIKKECGNDKVYCIQCNDLIEENIMCCKECFITVHPQCQDDLQPTCGSQGAIKISLKVSRILALEYAHYIDVIQVLKKEKYLILRQIGKTSNLREDVAKCLIRVFNGTFVQFVCGILRQEIIESANIETLFRANSMGSKALDVYMKNVAGSYLQEVFLNVLKKIVQSNDPFELDPNRLLSKSDSEENLGNLVKFIASIVDAIFSSVSKVPNVLKVIFASIQAAVTEKYPDSRNAKYTSISGFMFLRLISPAIMGPNLFQLNVGPLNETNLRKLKLIAKTIQSLGNLAEFGKKEEFMEPLNHFINARIPDMKRFIEQISTPDVGYVHIEKSYTKKELAIECSDLCSLLTSIAPKLTEIPESLKSELEKELEKVRFETETKMALLNTIDTGKVNVKKGIEYPGEPERYLLSNTQNSSLLVKINTENGTPISIVVQNGPEMENDKIMISTLKDIPLSIVTCKTKKMREEQVHDIQKGEIKDSALFINSKSEVVNMEEQLRPPDFSSNHNIIFVKSDPRISYQLVGKVTEGKNLGFGKQLNSIDFFYEVSLDSSSKKTYTSTRTANSESVTWIEEFRLNSPSDFQYLKIVVWYAQRENEYETFMHPIGKAIIPKSLMNGAEEWITLRDGTLEDKVSGSALFKFIYSGIKEKRHQFTVELVEAKDLSLGTTFLRPYACLDILPDINGSGLKRTIAIPNSNSPIFHQSFTFSTSTAIDPSLITFHCSFWNQNNNGAAHFIGQCNVSMEQVMTVDNDPPSDWVQLTALDDDSEFARLLNSKGSQTDFAKELILIIQDKKHPKHSHEPQSHSFTENKTKRDLICTVCKNPDKNDKILVCTMCNTAVHGDCSKDKQVRSCAIKRKDGEIRVRVQPVKWAILEHEGYYDFMDIIQKDGFKFLHVLGKYASGLGLREHVSQLLLSIYGDRFFELVICLLKREIMETTESKSLFRSNSMATKSLDVLMKHLGGPYLKVTLEKALRDVVQFYKPYEIDPTRPGCDPSNIKNLTEMMSKISDAIFKSASFMPKPLLAIFSIIRETVSLVFPGDELANYTSISGFIFLRFFNPLILSPNMYDLDAGVLDEKAKRKLTLVAKTLQNLSNLAEFGKKEVYMHPVNAFITQQIPNMKAFLDHVSVKPEIVKNSPIEPFDSSRECAELVEVFSNHLEKMKQGLAGEDLLNLDVSIKLIKHRAAAALKAHDDMEAQYQQVPKSPQKKWASENVLAKITTTFSKSRAGSEQSDLHSPLSKANSALLTLQTKKLSTRRSHRSVPSPTTSAKGSASAVGSAIGSNASSLHDSPIAESMQNK